MSKRKLGQAGDAFTVARWGLVSTLERTPDLSKPVRGTLSEEATDRLWLEWRTLRVVLPSRAP